MVRNWARAAGWRVVELLQRAYMPLLESRAFVALAEWAATLPDRPEKEQGR